MHKSKSLHLPNTSIVLHSVLLHSTTNMNVGSVYKHRPIEMTNGLIDNVGQTTPAIIAILAKLVQVLVEHNSQLVMAKHSHCVCFLLQLVVVL